MVELLTKIFNTNNLAAATNKNNRVKIGVISDFKKNKKCPMYSGVLPDRSLISDY